MRLYRLGNVKSPLLVGLAGADVVHRAATEREGDARDLVDLQRRAEHHAVHGHREDDQPKKDDGARSCVKLQGTYGPAVSEPTILFKFQKVPRVEMRAQYLDSPAGDDDAVSADIEVLHEDYPLQRDHQRSAGARRDHRNLFWVKFNL